MHEAKSETEIDQIEQTQNNNRRNFVVQEFLSSLQVVSKGLELINSLQETINYNTLIQLAQANWL